MIISRERAVVLLEYTDEDNEFEGIWRPNMMLKQNIYLAINECVKANTFELTGRKGSRAATLTARQHIVGQPDRISQWFVVIPRALTSA